LNSQPASCKSNALATRLPSHHSEWALVGPLHPDQPVVRMEWRPAGWLMSASVNLPLHHKVQKVSSGTGSPRWSRKKGRKMVVCVCIQRISSYNNEIINSYQSTTAKENYYKNVTGSILSSDSTTCTLYN